jgi:hypothetical protein
VRASRAASLAGVVLALGCHHAAVTEIVLVIDTDLRLPPQGSAYAGSADADALEIVVSSPRVNIDQAFGGGLASLGTVQHPTLPRFPATIGLVPRDDAGYAPFDVRAALYRMSSEVTPLEVVVERRATAVQFVRGETRVLYLSLLKACACAGTSCPATPPCADLAAPTLTPFDPERLPHVDAGATVDSGADAARDVAGDALTDHAGDAGEDAPRDVARDRAAEVEPDASRADVGPEAPTRFALGHSCMTTAQCQDGLCVDGVCCESQCACGTCGAGGKCSPATAGTDPRGACGLYTCDGNGACVTSCPQAYGACSSPCKDGAFCDGAGSCQMAVGMAGGFCVLGTCTCPAGLTCHPPDAGGAGVCL